MCFLLQSFVFSKGIRYVCDIDMISTKFTKIEAKELDFNGFKVNDFFALFLHLVVLAAVIVFGFITSVPTMILSACLCVVRLILFAGYMQLEPNEARAMVFFGKYQGTFKETGFFWVNPFLDKKKLSVGSALCR